MPGLNTQIYLFLYLSFFWGKKGKGKTLLCPLRGQGEQSFSCTHWFLHCLSSPSPVITGRERFRYAAPSLDGEGSVLTVLISDIYSHAPKWTKCAVNTMPKAITTVIFKTQEHSLSLIYSKIPNR